MGFVGVAGGAARAVAPSINNQQQSWFHSARARACSRTPHASRLSVGRVETAQRVVGVVGATAGELEVDQPPCEHPTPCRLLYRTSLV